MSNIHTNIKTLREEARLTQSEFAERIGVTKETVVLWEKGKLDPSRVEIRKMCPVLRIHEEDFLERDIQQERKDAGKRMKKSASRKDYNWYLGDKNVVRFYLSYVILFVVVVLVSLIASSILYSANQEAFEYMQVSKTFVFFMIYGPLSGIVTGIYLLIYIIKYRLLRFQWWYIFWISTLVAVFFALSIALTPIVFGYAFYKSIIKRGKNR